MDDYTLLKQCNIKLHDIKPLQKYFIVNDIPSELLEYITSFYIPLVINDCIKKRKVGISYYNKNKKISHKSRGIGQFSRPKSRKHSFKNKRKFKR